MGGLRSSFLFSTDSIDKLTGLIHLMLRMETKTLCIVIDMQEGFRHNAVMGILPVVRKYMEQFRGTVIISKFINRPGSLFETELDWPVFQKESEQLILEEMRGLAGKHKQFWHDGYTVTTPEVIDYIRSNGFQEIHLIGIFTDVCITKTAMDVFDLGVRPVVVKDCVQTLHGQDIQLATLESLKRIIGVHNVI